MLSEFLALAVGVGVRLVLPATAPSVTHLELIECLAGYEPCRYPQTFVLLYRYLNQALSVRYLALLCDLVTALLVFFIARNLPRDRLANSFGRQPTHELKSIKNESAPEPWLVACAFLLNPWTLSDSLALSTGSFTVLFIAWALLCCLRNRPTPGMFLLAIATCLTPHTSLYLPAMILLAANGSFTRGYRLLLTYLLGIGYLVCLEYVLVIGDDHGQSLLNCVSTQIKHAYTTVIAGNFDLSTLASSECFKYLNARSTTRFRYHLINTYSRWFTLEDLTPDSGLYWYFFTELFEPFRVFFLYVVQLHFFALAVPVCIKFRYDPMFCVYLVAGTLALLRPYPSLADAGFWLGALLPLQSKLFAYMRQPFVTISTLFISTLLLPLFYYTWIYAGGNANFYYAVTLVWAMGGILLISDSIWAHLRRTWDCFLFDERTPEFDKDAPVHVRATYRHVPVVLV